MAWNDPTSPLQQGLPSTMSGQGVNTPVPGYQAVPGYGPVPQGSASPVAGGPATMPGSTPAGAAFGSPLQAPAPPMSPLQPSQSPLMGQNPQGPVQVQQPGTPGMGQSAQPMVTGSAMPAAAGAATPPMPVMLPAGAVAEANTQLDDNAEVSADDITWINRARKVIAETQGDPYRQVQLLQHVRAQYLKQRFGRAVHTDEG